MSLTLIRHTAVAAAEGLCYGASDVPLADGFDAAAERLRGRLPPAPRRVLSSPSGRCRRLAETFGAEVIVDKRLSELNFGSWELRPWAEIPRGQLEVWCEDFVHRAPPGGETFAELAARAEACVRDAAERFPSEHVIFVTHAGVIRALLASRRGIALREAFSIPVGFGEACPLSV